jgi:predicted amidohydrolase
MQSFDFGVAAAALAAGFAPDTISTDQYLRHVGSQPQHDLPRTMSKLLAVGMSEADVFAAVTTRPARILGLDHEVGRLTPGACADVTALRWNPDAAALVDASGAMRPGGCWEPVLTVRAGQVVASSA